MKKFVIYIDYKAKKADNLGIEYKMIEVEGLEEAIEVADGMWNEKMYLMRIMKKIGKVEKENSDWNVETYEAILARRSYGWHRNNAENCEGEHRAQRHYTNGRKYRTSLEYIETI